VPFVRWRTGGLVVSVVLAAACSGDEGCGTAAAAVDVVEPEPAIGSPMVAIGDVLLATPPGLAESVDASKEALFRSSDGGASWEPVGLPDGPTGLSFGWQSLQRIGDVVVMSGRAVVESLDMEVPGGAAYVWTSADGMTWRGGRIAGGGPAFGNLTVSGVGDVLVAGVETGDIDFVNQPHVIELYRSADAGATWARAEVAADMTVAPGDWRDLEDLWEAPDGRLIAEVDLGDSTSDPSEQPVLVSADDGASWQAASCPLVPVDDSGRWCQAPLTASGLQVREAWVSVDDGQTWQLPDIEPAPEWAEPEEVAFESVVELSGGGWLATAGAATAGDTTYGFLLRSDDGVRWTQLLGADLCDYGRENVSLTPLIPWGDSWLTAYSCADLTSFVWTEAYSVDARGEDATPVAGTCRDRVSFLDPVPFDGRVLLPIEGEEAAVDGILALAGSPNPGRS
jgi:hypothetical protein